MRKSALVLVAGGTALLAMHGCGIDVIGVEALAGEDATSPSVTSPNDASTPDGDLFVPVDAAACTCGVTAPAGWSLVAYGDRAATCAGDLEPLDLVTEPDGSAACDCSCTTTPPSCAASKWGSKVDDSTTARCDTTSSVTHDVTTDCVKVGGSLGEHGRVIAATATDGKCTAASQKKLGAVKSTAVRVCRQKGATCACDAGPSLTTCVAKSGNEECPAGFPKKHVVAASVDVTCGACTCQLTQSCKSSVTWYSDSACANAIATIDSDSCKDQNGSSFSSVKYQVAATATCTTGAPPPGAATLVDPKTVCCP